MPELYDLVRADPLLSFLPQKAIEYFDGCFDLTLLELPAGAGFDTDGRVAYLLSGSGTAGSEEILSGRFFGLDRDCRPAAQRFTASAPCRVLLWDRAMIESCCYNQCWFHVRLMEEVRRAMGSGSGL